MKNVWLILESLVCVLVDDHNIMNWHWTYYFENGWKDIEGDMINNK